MSSLDGNSFLRAVNYAARAVPQDDARGTLAHVVFLNNRVIASDGQRWHVGVLPEEASLEEPMAVSRLSIRDLLLGLEYGRRMSKNGSRPFEVQITGSKVVIKFGDEKVTHKLDVIDVGEIGQVWEPPVPDHAPAFAGDQSKYRVQHVKDAMSWYKSWNKDYGEVSTFGFGNGHPVRFDIESGEELVVQAYLLPTAHPNAQLPDNDPLFAGAKGKKHSQAITALSLAGGPAAPAPKPEPGPVRKRGKKKKGADTAALDAGDDE